MNKIPLLISLVLLNFQGVFGQEFAIEHRKLNYAYPAIGNYLSVVVENKNCENIIVRTDNGTVEKTDSLECSFVFVPTRIGNANLSVYAVENLDTTKIGERIYRIKRWPKHKPYFGRISSQGKMSRGEFLAHIGVYVPIQHLDINGKIPVLSYRITITRNEEIEYDLKNIGGRIEMENHEILKNVKVGDEIFIHEIMVKMPAEPINRPLSDLRIEIIN